MTNNGWKTIGRSATGSLNADTRVNGHRTLSGKVKSLQMFINLFQ